MARAMAFCEIPMGLRYSSSKIAPGVIGGQERLATGSCAGDFRFMARGMYLDRLLLAKEGTTMTKDKGAGSPCGVGRRLSRGEGEALRRNTPSLETHYIDSGVSRP